MDTQGYLLRGWFVDLSERTTWASELPSDLSSVFLGGRGVGAWFLSEQPRIDALDPDAPLIFSIGPLTGSRIPASGRMMVSAFSPLTNTICSCSVGGRFALEMRKAGIDFIHVAGRSDRELMLKIDNSGVIFEEVRIPDHLPLNETFRSLSSWGGSSAAIGPGATVGCRYATIMVDGTYASGRGGLGLAMARKNLRAVLVRGNIRPKSADRDREDSARKDIIRLFDASPVIMGRSGLKHYGTATLVDLMASRHMMPTANFRRTYFEEYTSFSAPTIERLHHPSHHSCHGCPIACKKSSDRVLPEFETLSHFGALNENSDLESIIDANIICNEGGIDTITAASTIACLAEIRQTRYAGHALVEKVREIIMGDGDGELLRMGSAVLSRELGAPELSMSVKSLELPAYDPRGAYGMALAYCTSTRGACHLRAYPIAHEILRKPVATDRFSFSGKARIIKIAEDLNAVVDSIGACKFAFLGASLEEYAKGFSAVTGLELDTQDLLRAGDSIYTLERYINTLRGFARKDDMLPERFYTEPGTSAPGIDIPPIHRAAFEESLERYYRIRGCDPDGTLSEHRAKEIRVCRNR